ncbi:hypothetical protein AAG747_05500 [Rapidithrix thailandica]|uniref:Thiaminase-1 insert domain-containing protein n=1 Tax=Rapidithrix thailandica TaxID=413964 RepID=A0AAW9S4L9_9BACT
MNYLIRNTFVAFLFISHFITGCIAQNEKTDKRRDLIVSLYPYLPNTSDLYWKIETDFEQKFPEINLEVQLNSWYYYSQDSVKKRGINFDQADIYELDCVFLDEFISSGKIQKIPESINQNTTDYLPLASIAKRNETWYGVPHWVCGNFMYYKVGDNEIENVSNLKDLDEVLKNSSSKNGLLIDLKGKSTIGELYLDALFDEFGSYQRVKPFLSPDNINKTSVHNLNKLLALTADSLGRIDNYHDRLGYYAREFSKNEGRVYVGYAESSYYMITEQLQSCSFEDSCLVSENIKIGEWSMSNNGSNPIGWVDMFVIDSSVSGQKLDDAKSFIEFMMLDDTYKSILIPGWNESPRYILPAKSNLYSDSELIKNAPLYDQFYPIIKKAVPVTDLGLNYNLRAIGKKLDEELLTK